MAGDAADGNTDPLVWESFFWGLLSAVSLNIGSIIGVTCLPRQRVRAVLMSFGGGALLFALSIELFGGVLHSSEEAGSTDAVWVMEGSAVAGGLFFAALNHLLNVFGADVRKASTKKGRFARLRALLLRRLAVRLWKIPFFSVLTFEEVRDLIGSAMYKMRFGAGDVIMSSDRNDSGIFFILSGMVRLQVYGKDGKEELSPSPVCHLHHADVATCSMSSTKSWVETKPLNSWDLGSNQIFGDMRLLTGSYLQAQAVALESTKVLVLPGHEVARLIQEHAAVRDQISLKAVERLRQVTELRHLPDHALASLSTSCSLVRYRSGDKVFDGCVDASTAVMCLVLGSVEFRFKDRSVKRTLHASRLLCTEHLKTGQVSKPFSMVALEPSSVLVIQRSDISYAMSQVSIEAPYALKAPAVVDTPAGGATIHAMSLVPQESTTLSDEGVDDLPGQVAESRFDGCAEQAHGPGRGEDPDELEEPEPPPQTSPPTPPPKERSTAARRQAFKQRLALTMQIREAGLGLGSLGQELGWDEPGHQRQEEDPKNRLSRLGSMQSMSKASAVNLSELVVTDLELEEHHLDSDFQGLQGLPSLQRNSSRTLSNPRSSSKQSALRSPSKQSRISFRLGQVEDAPPLIQSPQAAPTDKSHSEASAETKAPPTPEECVEAGQTAAPQPSDGKRSGLSPGQHRAVMVWLGILIDAVPESLVIGILINKGAGDVEGADRASAAAAAALPFVIGVFLSNLPESMSSSGTMKLHGMRVSTILMMWLTTTVLTAAGAALGAVLFPPGSSGDHSTELAVVAVEGLAAGAMLTMIAQTMMPEAFEQGGDIVGLSCLAGFLSALSMKLIPIGGGQH